MWASVGAQSIAAPHTRRVGSVWCQRRGHPCGRVCLAEVARRGCHRQCGRRRRRRRRGCTRTQYPSAPSARRLVEELCAHASCTALTGTQGELTRSDQGVLTRYSQGTHRVPIGTQGVLTGNWGHITFTASSQYPHRSSQCFCESAPRVQAHLPTRHTAGCSEICLHRRGAC